MAVDLAQPDVTLLLDMGGVIREASVSRLLSNESVDGWLGSAWQDTVPDPACDKVRRMIDDARSSGISAFRQLTQRFPSGRTVPIEYTTVMLGGRAGMLAIGKSLLAVAELQSRFIASQQAMERDHWKLREVETRYRFLFNQTSEAVLLLRAGTTLIVEANPAAVKALGLDGSVRAQGAGQDLMAFVPVPERAGLRVMVKRALEMGKAPGMLVHFENGRGSWLVRAASVEGNPGPLVMLQLVPTGAVAAVPAPEGPPSIDAAMEQLPDGFVVLSQDGVVLRANRAFAKMVDMASVEAVLGERLDRWVWRPGADVPVLLATMREHHVARLFPTALHSELGAETDVEISGACMAGTDPAFFGLVLRDVGRRLSDQGDAPPSGTLLEQVAEPVGKVPLRQLIRSTIDNVERHYVKAALDQAGGNRTAAAELLGLSRQSLYVKLGRYGFSVDDPTDNDTAGDPGEG